ncbi:hypothetical protein, partial [Vibrio harveyi]|uniref:hypothetical protein n=1 Tax=Vibrio harveyi TaxID=669 RepID=UPI000D783330
IRCGNNAFYTALSHLSGTLPPSFMQKKVCMLALICMKQIENQYESVCSTTQLDGAGVPNSFTHANLIRLYK